MERKFDENKKSLFSWNWKKSGENSGLPSEIMVDCLLFKTSAVCLHFPLHTSIKFYLLTNFQITTIPRKTFPKLYELHTIDFSYNNISEIDNSVFANLLGLRNLNFTHNHLEQLRPTTFGKIPTLLQIDLSYNFLVKVGRGAFGGLASLRSINLENNRLKEIPSPSISMTHLHLAHNNISKIRGRSPWPVMNSLIYIDLDNNNLADTLDGGK